MPRSYAGWFRVVSVGEAVSWTALLVAMVVTYGFGQPLGVTITGWFHGFMFTAYLVVCLVVFSPLRWRFWELVLAVAASVPPLATLLFEWWANRRGMLSGREADEPTFWAKVRYALRELN